VQNYFFKWVIIVIFLLTLNNLLIKPQTVMEENRLKPMPADYDEQLFNRLYQETLPLRRVLARQIDSRRFGLAFEDILSFFDSKFIYVFSKHYKEDPNKLKAFLINSLKNFKCRILKSAYTHKYSQSIISLDVLVVEQPDIIADEVSNTKDFYYEKLMAFMKEHLSDNALLILELQINPPPYIIQKINIDKSKNLQKVPDQVILEYLDMGQSDNAYKYIKKLRKEIRNAVNYAKTTFKSSLS